MALPKVASQSILAALPKRQGIPTVPTIAFVRDPMDRFLSYFWFARKMDTRMTYRQAVDGLFGDQGGVTAFHYVHRLPQATMIPEGAEVHKFENINEVWRDYGFPALPHLNASPRGEVPDYRKAELLKYYEADLELRHA